MSKDSTKNEYLTTRENLLLYMETIHSDRNIQNTTEVVNFSKFYIQNDKS